MSIFNRKYKVEIEDYCSFIYDNLFLNSANGDDSIDSILIINLEQKIGSTLSNNDRQKAIIELRALQFELFALAWTHKFIVDLTVIKQSVFTKKYLLEKSMNIIWDKMNDYNDMIGAATLDWLTHVAKINLSFNYNMRKDLISKNIEIAKLEGFVMDESINRINNRIWSENAWRQNYVHKMIIPQFGKKLNILPADLNREDVLHFSEIINGSYNGANKSLKNIKIKK